MSGAERRMPPDETVPEASDDRMGAGGASLSSGPASPQGARGPGRGGGGGARQERPPVRRALSKLASLVDPPTALASASGSWLAVTFLSAGFSFILRGFSLGPRDLTMNDGIGCAYMVLSPLALFAPFFVAWLIRKRPDPPGGSMAFTWLVCVPASFALLFALMFVQVPHVDPSVAPFWFVYGASMPLMAIGDGFIWLVGLLTGRGLG